MYLPGYHTVTRLAEQYDIIPICKEIATGDITTQALLSTIATTAEQYFLLESADEGAGWSRYSFLGFRPIMRIACREHEVIQERYKSDGSIQKSNMTMEQPVEKLREIVSKYRAPKIKGFPHFAGGFVGYFAYTMMAHAEPSLKLSRSHVNDFDLMLFEDIIAFDHEDNKLKIIANMKTAEFPDSYREATERIEAIIQLIQNTTTATLPKPSIQPSFTCHTSKKDYIEQVEQARKHIYEGDIFQAVLSRRFEASYDGSLIPAYMELRNSNPSPYMVYLHMKEQEIISTSPETLVRLQDGRLTTFPVAGSRPRGRDAAQDALLTEELLHDEKELSEHNMLVDLGRNDLGKISEFSSVEVTRYQDIHKYSKIMHICSQVESVLAKGKDTFDAIEAVLPAGTLSGAPKIRAMEIIEELEDVPRGIYGGALGYIDFNGNMDTCIAIRMAVKEQNRITVQAGGGIVADSIPEKEYEESANKAAAVIRAIERSAEACL